MNDHRKTDFLGSPRMSPHRQLGDVTEQLCLREPIEPDPPPWCLRDLAIGLLWVATIMAAFALAQAQARRADAAVEGYYAGCMAQQRAVSTGVGEVRP